MVQVKTALPPLLLQEVVYEACGVSTVCVTGSGNWWNRKGQGGQGALVKFLEVFGFLRNQRRMDVDGSEVSEDVRTSETAYYFASLFARCDPEEKGLVKVSVLVNTLRELQAMAADSSEESVDDENVSLRELKQELDPAGEDPEITLGKFKEGITSYLEKDKRNNGYDGQLAGCGQEMDAGEALKLKKETDLLRTEIMDLKMQLNKANEDNVLLRNHVGAIQDENCTALQTLDKKLLELKSQAERIKRLERELNDKADIICGLEGRNAALCNKISQLGNELSTVHKERKKFQSENVCLKEEVKKSLNLLTSKDEFISKMKSETALAEMQWRGREKSLNDQINDLSHSIDALNQTINELEYENSKLKQRNKEKIVLETATTLAEELAAVDGTLLQTFSASPAIARSNSFAEENLNDIIQSYTPSDDIKTEMVDAGEYHQLPVVRSTIQRFDVATQCEMAVADNQVAVYQELKSCLLCSGVVECDSKERMNDQNLIAEQIPNASAEKSLCDELCKSTTEQFSRRRIYCLLILIAIGIATFTPIDDGCLTNPMIFLNIENYFKHCGQLSHDRVPII